MLLPFLKCEVDLADIVISRRGKAHAYDWAFPAVEVGPEIATPEWVSKLNPGPNVEMMDVAFESVDIVSIQTSHASRLPPQS